MKNRIFGGILAGLGLLTALTPRFILPVCEYHGKSVMLCSYTGRAEMLLGSLVLLAGVAALAAKGAEALRWLLFVGFFMGLGVLIVPAAIGYCASPRMPCNYGTIPLLRLLAVLLMIVSAVGFWLAPRGIQPSS